MDLFRTVQHGLYDETVCPGKILEGKGTEVQVRLFDMKPRVYTDAVAWDSAALAAVNRLEYYLPASWSLPEEDRVADFSAVAFHSGVCCQIVWKCRWG